MRKLVHPATIVATAALFVVLGGGAYAATKLVGHNQLAKHSVWHDNLANRSVHTNNLTRWINRRLGKTGKPGASGFNGAFYSVEKFTGTVSTGAIAAAACDPNNATNSQKYVAISGGVQDTDSSTNMTTNANPLPLAASFPGRMDYSTFTPKPGRLDGWIVQFGNSSIAGTQDNNLAVWALCVPASDDGGQVPVHVNSTTTN